MIVCPYDLKTECRGPQNGKAWWLCPIVEAALTPHWTTLCRTRPAYYEAWLRGEGPGQERWDVSQRSRGLGDTVAKLTHAVGLDKLAERAARRLGRKDCGCRKRQRKANRLVPYKG